MPLYIVDVFSAYSNHEILFMVMQLLMQVATVNSSAANANTEMFAAISNSFRPS